MQFEQWPTLKLLGLELLLGQVVGQALVSLSGAGVDIDEFIIRQPQQNGASILLSLDSFAGPVSLAVIELRSTASAASLEFRSWRLLAKGLTAPPFSVQTIGMLTFALASAACSRSFLRRGRHFLLGFHHQCVNLIADRAILFGQVFAIAFNDGIDDHSA